MAEGLRVGIVGVGNNAATHHLPAYRLLPNVEVMACCATTPERAQAGAVRLGIPKAYTDVGAMIRGEKLDAVSICSTMTPITRTRWTRFTLALTSCARSPWH